MKSRILKATVVALVLCASAIANAAPRPLGVFARRSESDPSIKNHRDVVVRMKHDRPVAIKYQTKQLPAHIVKRINVNKKIAAQKGSAR